MKKWILMYVLTGLCIILVNIFPRFDIKKMDDEQALFNLRQFETNLNESSFKYNDFKKLDDGNTLVSYDNGNLYCYRIHEICNSSFANASSQITLYNSDGNVIWSLGGNLQGQPNILYDNHHINIKAVDQLDDQSFVAFGRSVDLSTEVLYDVLLMIDNQGVINELRIINLLTYGYTHLGGTLFYDVQSTDDGGFTLRFTDLFNGSVLIHFNDMKEEEWFVRFDDVVEGGVYSGIYSAASMETFQFQNGMHYLLLENHLYAYDLSGNLVWDILYTDRVTGLTVDSYGNLYISRMLYTFINQKNSLFSIRIDAIPITTLITQKIDGNQGDIVWENHYITQTDYRHLVLYSYHVYQDNGYYYNLIRNQWYAEEMYYEMVVFKYDDEGRFIGSSKIGGNYTNPNNLSRISSVFLKKDVYIEDHEVFIMTPTLTFNASFTMNDLPYDEPMPIDFLINHYELTIQLRSIINTLFALTSLGIVSFVGYHLFRRYYKRYPKLEDI